MHTEYNEIKILLHIGLNPVFVDKLAYLLLITLSFLELIMKLKLNKIILNEGFPYNNFITSVGPNVDVNIVKYQEPINGLLKIYTTSEITSKS